MVRMYEVYMLYKLQFTKIHTTSCLFQHLCIGAQQDIRTLLHRTAILFDEYGDLRFQHFRDIFQDMKFSLIFAGRYVMNFVWFNALQEKKADAV